MFFIRVVLRQSQTTEEKRSFIIGPIVVWQIACLLTHTDQVVAIANVEALAVGWPPKKNIVLEMFRMVVNLHFLKRPQAVSPPFDTTSSSSSSREAFFFKKKKWKLKNSFKQKNSC